MKIVIKQGLEDNEIGIHHQILPKEEKGIFEMGQWTKEVYFQRIDNEEEIHVPENFFPFDIPLNLPYMLKIEKGRLKLGPVIAYLVTSRKQMHLGIKRYKRYMKHYPKVQGLVFITTVTQTDFVQERMKGYYYNPEKKDFDPIERCFPFPDAIYRRCAFRKNSTYRILRQKLQNRIFNGPVLNKYKQYKTFLKNKQLLSHFPRTRLLKTIKSVDTLLAKFPTVYLKPTNSYKAKGIVTVSKNGAKYIVTQGKAKKEISRKAFKKYIKKIKKKKKYIVQQAIPNVDHKNIVFRAIMQKNDENKWLYTGGYARVGSQGSVVTNRTHTKEFMSIENCLRLYYGLSKSQTKRQVESLVQTCIDVCKGFDKTEVNFGDLAFDIMMDSNLKVWVIEVNNRAHNHRSPLLTVRDRKLYRRVVSTPLLYAKYLSGF